jgi:NTP pyrophosphatase (non-canonical NTP hydrolase)
MKNKILEWAKEKGILEKATPKDQMLKTVEEVGELADAIGKNDKEEIKDAIGDIAVTIMIQAELNGLDYDECVKSAYEVIAKRNGKMVNGIFVKDK